MEGYRGMTYLLPRGGGRKRILMVEYGVIHGQTIVATASGSLSGIVEVFH
jgi:hypothetical protein